MLAKFETTPYFNPHSLATHTRLDILSSPGKKCLEEFMETP